jgi:tripartite-type tricarboxylate transporter receptor subunit TctC
LQKTPYDPIKDFSPITQTLAEPMVIVVNAAVPVKTLKELIELAKAKPGELNYGSVGYGSSSNLAPELFKSLTGINIVHVPYKSGGVAVNGVLVNEVQVMFEGPQLLPHIKTGKLRALAVTSARPSPIFPDLPTVAASGLPGFEATTMQGLQAPAKTPDAIIRRLNQEIVRVMNQPDVKEKFLNRGAEVIAGSPEAYGAELKAVTTKWAKVIKDAGIKVD